MEVNQLKDIIDKEGVILLSLTPGTDQYNTVAKAYNEHLKILNDAYDAETKRIESSNRKTADAYRATLDERKIVEENKTNRLKILSDVGKFGGAILVGFGISWFEKTDFLTGTTPKQIVRNILGFIK